MKWPFPPFSQLPHDIHHGGVLKQDKRGWEAACEHQDNKLAAYVQAWFSYSSARKPSNYSNSKILDRFNE